MKKCLMLVSALLVTSGSALQLVSGSNNAQFADMMKTLGMGTCIADSYSANLTAQDSMRPFTLGIKDFRDVTVQSLNTPTSGADFRIIRTLQDTPYSYVDLVLITLKSSGVTGYMARRSMFVNGYEIIESCRVP